MGLSVISAPEQEPITLALAKLEAGVDADITAFDSLFQSYWIPTAREQAEHRTGRALVTQTLRHTRDCFPGCAVRLPRPALQSVEHVKYIDPNGALQTLDPSRYQVVTDELLGWVLPAYGEAWPSVRAQPGAVQIQYVAGYGTPEQVPVSIKHWMLMAVATWFKQHEAVVTGTIVAELPRDFFAALLDPHSVEWL
ncbi:head-tail connector protein [Methylobacillus flagellatus]|uniref:head-tail connector protein n=1 Tax=Methylobacillus flagellatus TaxID=405 RepID=UPI0010F7274D|nr:hypothetical protein [Methylobacillus flagellatus]